MKNNRACAKLGLACGLVLTLVLAGCASNSLAPVFGWDGQIITVVDKNFYAVKSGDTLYRIARKHGIEPRDLIMLNRIENPNQISAGLILKVKPPQEAISPIAPDVVVTKPLSDAPGVQQESLHSAIVMFKREPKAGKLPYLKEALPRLQNQPKILEPSASQVTPESKLEAKSTEAASSNEKLSLIWPASGKLLSSFSNNGNKGINIVGKSGDPVIAAGDGKVILVSNAMRGYGNLVIIKHNDTYLSAYAHNRKILVDEKQSVSKGQRIAEMGNTDAENVMLHFEVRRHGKPVDPLKYLPQR